MQPGMLRSSLSVARPVQLDACGHSTLRREPVEQPCLTLQLNLIKTRIHYYNPFFPNTVRIRICTFCTTIVLRLHMGGGLGALRCQVLLR